MFVRMSVGTGWKRVENSWSLFIADAKILQIVRTIDADYWMKIVENLLVLLKLFTIHIIVC